MTQKTVAILLLAALACPALGQTKSLTLRNGSVVIGEVNKVPDGYEVTTKLGTVVYSADDVVSITDVTTPTDELARRRAQADPNSAADYYAIARWAESQGMLVEARKDLTKALKIDPDYEQAAVLLRIVNRRIEQIEKARDAVTPVVTPRGALDRLLIGEQDIYRIRLGEVEVERGTNDLRILQERVPVTFEGRLVDDFLEFMNGREEFTSRSFEDRFRRLSTRQQVAFMLRSIPERHPMLDRIHIQRDPEFMRTFRGRVWPVVQKLVIEMFADRGIDPVRLKRLMNVRNDQHAYTTYILIDGYTEGRRRMIDRVRPVDSLLLQYGLPEEFAKYRPGRKLPEIYNGRRDRRYRRVLAWIRSLEIPHPKYGLAYEPPWGLTLDFGKPGELPTPEPPADDEPNETPVAAPNAP
jgi:hypothetical protein